MKTIAALLLLTTHAQAHQFYNEWRVPGQPESSCCNNRDCHPTDMCVTSAGREGIMVNDECWDIPQQAILPGLSEDGRAHVCLSNTGITMHIRCVRLPGDT